MQGAHTHARLPCTFFLYILHNNFHIIQIWVNIWAVDEQLERILHQAHDSNAHQLNHLHATQGTPFCFQGWDLRKSIYLKFSLEINTNVYRCWMCVDEFENVKNSKTCRLKTAHRWGWFCSTLSMIIVPTCRLSFSQRANIFSTYSSAEWVNNF